MEYTRDVLEDAFGVSGGSAIQSDGDFFWRRDTADYVEHYGVELPKAFLEHGRRRRWALPTLSRDELLAIDGYLMGLRRPAR